VVPTTDVVHEIVMATGMAVSTRLVLAAGAVTATVGTVGAIVVDVASLGVTAGRVEGSDRTVVGAGVAAAAWGGVTGTGGGTVGGPVVTGDWSSTLGDVVDTGPVVVADSVVVGASVGTVETR
jgi:hypothetical protein